MKTHQSAVLFDYAVMLCRKFLAYCTETEMDTGSGAKLLKDFAVEHHPLHEYRSLYRSEEFQNFSTDEIRLLILLLGENLRMNQRTDLWTVSHFFHKRPDAAIAFIENIMAEESALVSEGLLLIEQSSVGGGLAGYLAAYQNVSVFLSPKAVNLLMKLSDKQAFSAVPQFHFRKEYKNPSEVVKDIRSYVNTLSFYLALARMSGSENVYTEGEIAENTEFLRSKIVESKVESGLKDFILYYDIRGFEMAFLALLVDESFVQNVFRLKSLESVIQTLSVGAEDIQSVIACFNSESPFVKESVIGEIDFLDVPVESAESEEVDAILEELEEAMGEFEFEASFGGLGFSRERVFQMLFRENTLLADKSEEEKADALSSLDEDHSARSKVSGLFEIFKPQVSIDHVILDKQIKEELIGAIDSARTADVMREWEVKPSLSSQSYSSIKILLYGVSGTGKTLTAEALAYEAGAELFKVDASNLVTSWVGESAKNVKKVFREFYKYVKTSGKKAFMFFNEADQLLSARGSVAQAADKEYNQMQNLLLEELENFDGVFIATTNLIELFDSAWSRRFNIKIRFEIPSFETRRKLWEVHLPKKLPVAADVDLKVLSESELSGGSIANVVYNAARRAALREEGSRIVTQNDFLDAIKSEKSAMLGGNKRKVGFE